MVARATARASVVGQPESAQPVALTEHERDRVAELDELRLAEAGVQARPQRLVGGVGVPRDRVRPRERRALALVEALGVVGPRDDLVVLGEIAVAQLL